MVSEPKIRDRRVRPGRKRRTKKILAGWDRNWRPETSAFWLDGKPNLDPNSISFLFGLMLALNPPEETDREAFSEGDFLFCD